MQALAKKTVAVLKGMCVEKGLSNQGNKQDLVNRLFAAL